MMGKQGRRPPPLRATLARSNRVWGDPNKQEKASGLPLALLAV